MCFEKFILFDNFVFDFVKLLFRLKDLCLKEEKFFIIICFYKKLELEIFDSIIFLIDDFWLIVE